VSLLMIWPVKPFEKVDVGSSEFVNPDGMHGSILSVISHRLKIWVIRLHPDRGADSDEAAPLFRDDCAP
jgi:hypothetical protein